jgi:large subunit ribosomal protein L6
MSRIGNRAIEIPKGVTISIKPQAIEVKGPKGTLTAKRHEAVEIKEEKGSAGLHSLRQHHPRARRPRPDAGADQQPDHRRDQGFRAHARDQRRRLSAEVKGSNIRAHPRLLAPHRVQAARGCGSAKVDKNNLILSGMDKQALGAAAAKLRSFRAPEPYKGKGVKYAEETIHP